MPEPNRTPRPTLRCSAGYRPSRSSTTRCALGTGELRPHWEYLIRSLEALGPEEFQRRWVEVRRLLHENGVTYNVYAEAQTTERLWPLDPIPVLLTSAEWSVIEQGLIQRAELLRPAARRPLRPAKADPQGGAAAGIDVRTSGLPAPVLGRRALGSLPCRCTPPIWRARRTGRCASSAIARRRPPAPATPWRTAPCCRACCRVCTATHTCTVWPRSSAPCARRCTTWRPRHQDNPRIVLLTPGAGQRDLLRARVSGQLSRLPARAGQRPGDARQPRVAQRPRRSEARRRHPAPRRRQLLRSTRAARRLVARHARSVAGRARSGTWRSSTRSAAASWRTPA